MLILILAGAKFCHSTFVGDSNKAGILDKMVKFATIFFYLFLWCWIIAIHAIIFSNGGLTCAGLRSNYDNPIVKPFIVPGKGHFLLGVVITFWVCHLVGLVCALVYFVTNRNKPLDRSSMIDSSDLSP